MIGLKDNPDRASVAALLGEGSAAAMPTVDTIKSLVASHWGVTVLDLESQRRERVVAFPRMVAMYLCKEMTALSLPAIGRRFGMRDHTTVMHAHRRISAALDEDKDLRERVDGLRATLKRFGNLVEPVTAGSLEAAALATMVQMVRDAKTDGRPVQGDADTVRLLLQEGFGEEPQFAAVNHDGESIEWLVSPTGSWSRIEIHGSVATIVDGGASWRSL